MFSSTSILVVMVLFYGVISSSFANPGPSDLYDKTCSLRFTGNVSGDVFDQLGGQFSEGTLKDVHRILEKKGYRVTSNYIEGDDHLKGYIHFIPASNREPYEPVRELIIYNHSGDVINCSIEGDIFSPARWAKRMAKNVPRCIVTKDQKKIKDQWKNGHFDNDGCYFLRSRE